MTKLTTIGALICALGATQAAAAPLQFTLSGTDNLSFTLDSNPTPDGNSTSAQAEFDGVPVFLNGSTSATLEDIDFFTATNFGFPVGGFQIFDDSVANPIIEASTRGAQVFTGPVSAPVFTAGTSFNFTASGLFLAAPINDTLTITAAASPVPEPATWGMMLFGVVVLGAAMRPKHKVGSAVRLT